MKLCQDLSSPWWHGRKWNEAFVAAHSCLSMFHKYRWLGPAMYTLLLQEKMPPSHCQGNIPSRTFLPVTKMPSQTQDGWNSTVCMEFHSHLFLHLLWMYLKQSVRSGFIKHSWQRGAGLSWYWPLKRPSFAAQKCRYWNFKFNCACCKCGIYEMCFVLKATGKLFYFSETYSTCSTQQ